MDFHWSFFAKLCFLRISSLIVNKRAKFIKMTTLFFAVDYQNNIGRILERNSGFNRKDDAVTSFVCINK